jgi:undecaprenyl-diphosphatase
LTTLCNNGEIWIVCGVILLFFKKYRRYGIFVLVAMLLGSLIGNEILKPLIARARPCHIDTAIELLVERPTSFSFPSGHTCSSAVAATVLTMANKKFGYAVIPVAALIAFSRLYVFVHFPTDVLAGAILGIGLGLVVSIFGNKLFDKLSWLMTNKETPEK